MRFFNLTMIGAAVALVSACASQPEPEAPGPVVEAPATTNRTAPTTTPAPTNPGPAAGSRADFVSKVGGEDATRVYFEYDSYALDDADRAVLARHAQWLKQYPSVRVQIEGNADERGTEEYNMALGARRADAAASYLVSLGIDAGRVSTVSYGKTRPIDPGSNEGAWSRNRNAHTNLVGGASS
jgi:peptidoglycan-associated lipoprotein